MKGDLDQTTPEELNDMGVIFRKYFIENNSVEDVQSYMDKLMEAGDWFGVSLTAVGVRCLGFPKRKENESDDSYQKR